MKKNCALLMSVLMLVFSLTACGGRSSKDPGAGNPPAEPPVAENGASAPANDSALGNALDDAANNAENAIDDILPGNDSAHTDQGGVSYGDMLENGTVEDAPLPSESSRGRLR